ncbi:MAG: hypothetical protein ABR613_11325 [Actinomycetota bacterium]
MKAALAGLVIVTLVMTGTFSEAVARPWIGTQHKATLVEVRDNLDDVLLSDGVSKTYTEGEAGSTRVTDFSNDNPSNFTDDTLSDHFQFQPGGKRRVRINSPYANDGVPFTCEFTYIVFKTSQPLNYDWYNDVIPGGSTVSDAFFICNQDQQRRWVVTYPDRASECAVIEHLDAATWRFSIPGYHTLTGTGCAATLTTSIKDKGQTMETESSPISAPLQITVTIP